MPAGDYHYIANNSGSSLPFIGANWVVPKDNVSGDYSSDGIGSWPPNMTTQPQVYIPPTTFIPGTTGITFTPAVPPPNPEALEEIMRLFIENQPPAGLLTAPLWDKEEPKKAAAPEPDLEEQDEDKSPQRLIEL